MNIKRKYKTNNLVGCDNIKKNLVINVFFL